jgi:alkanesulfonate monooxygenase SsuD/methylene tetrahydromethanopterin reductase-like flavin-dependent oxidoreductase (luciferase family)
MKCGIFDWLEHREAPLDQIFEERLQMLEYGDDLGFYAYHVAEHQGTPLSLDSSPAVFLAAASQRTSRLRLVPTVFVLPWYNPFRLYNEICMLDQLSHGRLEVGLGSGTSPIESTYFGVAPTDLNVPTLRLKSEAPCADGSLKHANLYWVRGADVIGARSADWDSRRRWRAQTLLYVRPCWRRRISGFTNASRGRRSAENGEKLASSRRLPTRVGT